jgi:hypothetical protein
LIEGSTRCGDRAAAQSRQREEQETEHGRDLRSSSKPNPS